MIDKSGGWTKLASTVVFHSPWFEVCRDEALRPDGSPAEYDHVVVPGAVTILAVDDTGAVAVTRQWIYLHRGTQWRLPAGRIEQADPAPVAAARRELREETGISAENWRNLGVINLADSFTDHRDHVFFASGLRAGNAQLEQGEADLEVHFLPFVEVLGLVWDGLMPHAGSSFAVLLAHALELA